MNISFIENLTNDMCRVLKEHNYPYDKSAVRKIVSKSLAAKQGLIDIFSKNPCWNESQLCIHFEHDYDRKIKPEEYRSFLNWLWAASDDRFKPEGIPTMDSIHTWEDPVDVRMGYYNIYDELVNLPAETTLPEFEPEEELNYWYRDRQAKYKTALERINKLDEKWNFRPGMKLNRIVNKICVKYGWDKLVGYDRRYAFFSDSMTPLKVKRQTTISVNPIDFLLMSHGNSWKSCHWIGWDESEAGCYSSGTVSYMLGEDSFIVSAIDENASGERLAEEPKILRQVFGYHDYQLLQSRLYPQDCDSGAKELYDNIRGMVEEVIAQALDEPNRWTKDAMNVNSDGTAYQDWNCMSVCSMHTLLNHVEDTKEPIMMSREPICVQCGCEHGYEESILCDDCQGHYCADCGCHIDLSDEDSYVTNDDGDYYCTECRVYCAKCGAVERRDYSVWISDIGERWCDWCASKYATVCNECGHYLSEAYTHDHEGNVLCEDCFDSYYDECYECGAVYRVEEMEDIEGWRHCPECAEKKKNEEESA